MKQSQEGLVRFFFGRYSLPMGSACRPLRSAKIVKK